LAGLGAAVVLLVLGGLAPLGASAWFGLESDVISFRMTGQAWPLLPYVRPVLSVLVHGAIALLTVGLYNACACLIAPLSFTINTTPTPPPG